MMGEKQSTVTRSMTKDLEQDVSSSIKDEVTSFLKSESFRSIIQNAVTEAVKACIEEHDCSALARRGEGFEIIDYTTRG